MRKKDYVAIAKVIRENLKSPNEDLVSELCRIFSETNDSFDSDRFREACNER